MNFRCLALFLGNNRQHRPIWTKTISSWTRTVFSIATAHTYPDILQAAVSVDLVAGVSLVSILQAGDWVRVSTAARHYFPKYALAWIQCAVICLSEMSIS